MSLAVIPSSLKALPDRWRQQVRVRRELTTVDAAADALEKAASELAAAIEKAQDETRLVTVEEYAKPRGVGPGTVRKWCGRGQVAGAIRNDAGRWMIPFNAVRTAERVRR